jgi:hypothetical protein
MKRFLFSLAILLTGVLSAQAQCNLCLPICELEKNIMLSQCAMQAYPEIALAYYDYFTDGQVFHFPRDRAAQTTECEFEAELAYRNCVGVCTGYYPD